MIKIGKETFINNGATIVADKGSILIGKRCLIGTEVPFTIQIFTAFRFRIE